MPAGDNFLKFNFSKSAAAASPAPRLLLRRTAAAGFAPGRVGGWGKARVYLRLCAHMLKRRSISEKMQSEEYL